MIFGCKGTINNWIRATNALVFSLFISKNAVFLQCFAFFRPFSERKYVLEGVYVFG